MAACLSVSGRSWRRLACAALAGSLGACAGQSDLSRVGSLLVQQVAGIGSTSYVSRAQVLAIPYATLGVRLGSSDQAMLVLEGTSAGTLQWVGGTQFAIATRNGRILRTVGFEHNLASLQPAGPAAGGTDYRYDLPDLNAYGVAVHCSETDAGREQIEILGDAHQTEHVLEDCVAPELDWTFRNEFWRDSANGFVWRSVQSVHPGLDPLELETLRPAG